MKKALLFLAGALSALSAYAQNNTFPTTGDVGIGTTTPAGSGIHITRTQTWGNGLYLDARAITGGKSWAIQSLGGNHTLGNGHFQIRNASLGKSVFAIDGNTGYLALGEVTYSTDMPQANLDIKGASSPWLRIRTGSSSSGAGVFLGVATSAGLHSPLSATNDAVLGTNGSLAQNLLIQTRTAGKSIRFATANSGGTLMERMQINGEGQIKIGTPVPAAHADYRLSIDGKVVAKSVYVTATSWADYVFDSEYELMPLEQVENYILAEGHLPEMPTTAEVLEAGIDVAKMDELLLKKIEELTLHLIELKKENKLLLEQNRKILAELNTSLN